MQTMVYSSNMHYSKINKKSKLNIKFPLEIKTFNFPISTLLLEGGLNILDIDTLSLKQIDTLSTQLNSLKHREDALEQPIILNPHTKLKFSCNNPYFLFAINLSVFLSFKPFNLQKRQFSKYLMSQIVKNKMSLNPILNSIANCF